MGSGGGGPAARFAHRFRSESNRYVEYSFGAAADTHGTMISGLGPDLLARVQEIAELLPFTAGWLRGVTHIVRHLQPPAYYFKVDWRAGAVERLTLYCRFANLVAGPRLAAALCDAAPLRWEGPPPEALGLPEPGPHIVGLRVDAAGRHGTSLYFRLVDSRERFLSRILPRLLAELTLPLSIVDDAARAFAGTAGLSPPHTLGIDSPRDGAPARLKIDLAGVALADALSWLARAEVSPARIGELARIGRGLGLHRLSYLAHHFSAGGHIAWKLYMLARPQSRRWGTSPGLQIDDSPPARDLHPSPTRW